MIGSILRVSQRRRCHLLLTLSACRQSFITSRFPAFAVIANITCERLSHIIVHCDFVSLIVLVLGAEKQSGPRIDNWVMEEGRLETELYGGVRRYITEVQTVIDWWQNEGGVTKLTVCTSVLPVDQICKRPKL
jgi:hypothetical protein